MEDTQVTKSITGVSRILLYALIIFALILLIMQVRSCQKDKQYADFEIMLKQSRDSTIMYKNKHGEEVYARTQVQGSLENMNKLYGKRYLDSLASVFNTKMNKVAEYVNLSVKKMSDVPLLVQDVVYETPASDYTGPIPCPQVKYMTGTFVSPFDSSVVRLGDSAYNRIYSTDELDLVTTKKNVGSFLNPRWENVVNVKGRNPDATYKVGTNFRIAETKPARIVLVAYGGVGYDAFNFKGWKRPTTHFGLGVGYVLARLK